MKDNQVNNSTIETILQNLASNDLQRQARALVESVDNRVYSAYPRIIELLDSPDEGIRSSAAWALGYLSQKESKDNIGRALVQKLTDEEELVRSEVVETLGILDYMPALQKIQALVINDPSELVRASAAETLGLLGDSSSLEILESALLNYDEDEAVRAYAANSIGWIAPQKYLPKLETYAHSESSLSVKAELLGAEYWLGDGNALKKLLNLLESADENLATPILNILTDLTDRKAPLVIGEEVSHLKQILQELGQRIPILRPHTEQILATNGI